MSIPLEDNFNDVLGKAIRGTGRSAAQLGAEAGVEPARLQAVLDGEFDAVVVRAVAPLLDLEPDRVVALGEGSYRPALVSVVGLEGFNTPFGEMTVNAYLVWDPASKSAAVFDTGSDADGPIEAARALGRRIEQVFITHGHGDHIFDLDRLVEQTGAKAWAPLGEDVAGVEAFSPGESFTVGGLRIETRLTRGHCPAGITYVVWGLERPVAICGDALFAGSMGGGGISYADALATNRAALFTLPDETILAPGHGPLTTIGEQRRRNPFFPEQ